MKTVKHCLLLFLILVTTIPAVAQVPELVNDARFRSDAQAAVDSIYNFNFEGAEEVLSSWKEDYPEHPLWTLMDGMKVWWGVLSDLEDTSRDDELITVMKKANYQAGKLLHRQSSHADALIIQAIANGYIGRQYSNRQEWISSLNYARKAMNTYEYLLELQPDMEDLKLAEGLKRYYSAYLPEAYPVVKTVSWFLPEGDKQKGLRLIREASQKATFARAEALYFLGNINYNYEKDYAAAIPYFEQLTTRYPRNNYYARILTKSYYQRRRYNRALRFIDKTLERWKDHQLPHGKVLREELLTWKGRILEQKNRTDEALQQYRQAFELGEELPNTSHRSFWVVSGYLSGKLLAEQQHFEEAIYYLKQVAEADTAPDYRQKARELISKID
ncbi:Tetratricopeptide repeat-containing protein [Fodinibius roseus]|uniref:Tetratricopeptide repeat-containing protein n=1 Tax=Fodinibius roseus TaxID=1194090 RepID=A0A1M5ANF2_9BACT|nr:tetratricopeptide repeat protein [Fodinibius roseus]SHF31696.1 Tetratricopeptide repeat-containing protein [Fodinibius roseus]